MIKDFEKIYRRIAQISRRWTPIKWNSEHIWLCHNVKLWPFCPQHLISCFFQNALWTTARWKFINAFCRYCGNTARDTLSHTQLWNRGRGIRWIKHSNFHYLENALSRKKHYRNKQTVDINRRYVIQCHRGIWERYESTYKMLSGDYENIRKIGSS